MSILRTFIYWWVWWGRNALYYYSRPFVWPCLLCVWACKKMMNPTILTRMGREIIAGYHGERARAESR